MKWITRSHVHVDRVACPWLITRFIDNEAEFLFVPKSQVDLVAKETGAIPFDSPGVELGHHEGRCSFESILLIEKFLFEPDQRSKFQFCDTAEIIGTFGHFNLVLGLLDLLAQVAKPRHRALLALPALLQ